MITTHPVRIVVTRALNHDMSCNPKLASVVRVSIVRFQLNDWGKTKDKELNDSQPLYAMGVYPAPCSEGCIWIKSDDYPDEGFRLLTLLYPSEY